MPRNRSLASSQSILDHKLTDFFQRKSQANTGTHYSSSCTPSSPLACSSQTSVSDPPFKHQLSRKDQDILLYNNSSSRKTEASRKFAAKIVQHALTSSQEPLSGACVDKKENAPPLITMPRKREVFSVSSTSSRGVGSVISISSDSSASKSVISISSGSVQSAALKPIKGAVNSMLSGGPLRRSQRQASVIDLTRNSPSPNPISVNLKAKTEKKSSPGKRKRVITSKAVEKTVVDSKRGSSKARNPPEVVEDCIFTTVQPRNKSSRSQPANSLPPRKRAKTNLDKQEEETSEVIPSSQSDEQELSLPKSWLRKDFDEIKQSVLAWQKASQDSSSANAVSDFSVCNDTEVPMDVDAGELSFLSSASKERSTHEHFSCPTSPQNTVKCDPSNSPSRRSSITHVDPTSSLSMKKFDDLIPPQTYAPTTLPMTSEEKTAQIIADIKRRAQLAASSSNLEDESYDEPLSELTESSDEDEDDSVFRLMQRSSVPAASTSNRTSSSSTGLVEQTPRRSSRLQNSPEQAKSDLRFRTPRRANSNLRKPSAADPIAALLRTKEASERRKLKASDRSSTLEHSIEQFDDPIPCPPSFNLPYDSIMGDSLMDSLGEDGNAIRRIIHDDRDTQKKRKGKQKETLEPVLGVPFWGDQTDVDLGSISFEIPKPPQSLLHSCSYLQNFIESHDLDSIGMLFDCGLLSLKTSSNTDDMVWLLHVALSPIAVLADKACTVILKEIEQASMSSRRFKSGIPVDVVKNSLLRLGMKKEFIEIFYLSESENEASSFTAEDRQLLVFRLVTLIGALASIKMFEDEQVGNLVAMLLGIAMDPSSDASLQHSIKTSIEIICNSYCCLTGRNDSELSICRQALLLRGDMDITNRNLLVSFLSGGTPVTRRIAQWIAFGMLAGDTAIDIAGESDEDVLPPLRVIYDMLSCRVNDVISEDVVHMFDINHIEDDADYDRLSRNAELLSRVLSNVQFYMCLDKMRPSEFSSATNAAKDKMRDKTSKELLEQIEDALKGITGRIRDNGSKKEKTRAKSTIQRLVNRLYHQKRMGLCIARETIWFKKIEPK